MSANGGSCVYVSPTGSVNGRVRTSGTYTVTNEGQIRNPGSQGILDNTSDTTIVNRGQIDARDAIVVRHRSAITNTGTLLSTRHGIRARNDSGVDNRGFIDAGRHGILLNNRSSVRNEGTIRSGFHGIRVLDDSIVVHRGTIDAGRYGIYARRRSQVHASGQIRSTWDGIRMLDDGLVANDASIDSSRRGIYVRDRSSVVNTGRIDSVLRAIEGRNDATLVNRGIARSSTREGIFARARANVVNRGTAHGTFGIRLNGNDGTITNSGRVVGTSGTAIRFRGGTNQLTLETGSQIVGDIRGGTGADSVFLHGSGGFGGRFLAFESLIRRGAGRWALSGTSTIAGPVMISGGTLQVDGVLDAASFSIGSAGSLSGRGTVVPDVDVRGAVMPGTAGGIGQLRTRGDVTFHRGSRLEIDVTPNSSDRLGIEGKAILRGGTIVITPTRGTYRDGQRYDVLTAKGGHVGRFSATSSSSSPVLRFEALYPEGRVQLQVERLPYASLPTFTPNQSSVADAFDRVVAAGSSPATSTLTSSLDFLSESEIGVAMTSMDPEIFDAYARLAGPLAELRFDMIERRMRTAVGNEPDLGLRLREPSLADPETEPPETGESLPAVSSPGPIRPTLWAYGLGMSGDKRGGVDVTGYDFDGAGAMLGADMLFSEGLRMGLAASWQQTDVAFDRPGSKGEILGRGLALYATHDGGGPISIDVMVQQLWNRYQSERQVAFGDVMRRATSDHDGRVFAAQAAAGIPFGWSHFSWEPRLGIRYARLSQDGFEEEGAGVFNLAVDRRASDGLQSFVGLRLASRFRILDERLELAPEIHGEWAHQWLSSDRRIGASLPGLGQTSFGVKGDERADQEWSVGIGVEAFWTERLRFELQYDFQYRRDELRSHALVGGVEWLF
ncbi:MAG: autotransporter domain-containing protein [bacterium]|nr:autotransporter domain-containing protein [bacterium]MCP5067162.1 autotransporter domain-containing protein [bacterium]